MSMRLNLQDFDAADRSSRESTAEEILQRRIAESEGRARADGYEQGVAAAAADAAREERQILMQIVELLQDLRHDREEIKASLLAELKPVLIAMVGVILPRLARDGLADELARTLSDIAIDVAPSTVAVFVAPERVDALSTAIGEITEVSADPTLPDDAVWLKWDDGGAVIEPARCIMAAEALLDRHFQVTEQRVRYG